jgi:hypothetical protein
MNDFVNDRLHTNLDYTLAPVQGVQRHLAPGMHARVVAEDVITTEREGVWLEVLSCSDAGLYLGQVCAPVRRFSQLPVGEAIFFLLGHVLEARGAVVAA